MHSKRRDDIMRANSGAAAVQLDLFFAANNSIEPGGVYGLGRLRLAALGAGTFWNLLASN